ATPAASKAAGVVCSERRSVAVEEVRGTRCGVVCVVLADHALKNNLHPLCRSLGLCRNTQLHSDGLSHADGRYRASEIRRIAVRVGVVLDDEPREAPVSLGIV